MRIYIALSTLKDAHMSPMRYVRMGGPAVFRSDRACRGVEMQTDVHTHHRAFSTGAVYNNETLGNNREIDFYELTNKTQREIGPKIFLMAAIHERSPSAGYCLNIYKQDAQSHSISRRSSASMKN
ncbi:hypothetical protein EVAR_85814_1 [Eumeta japonica]|uniref:Uncharacterized protein n=1 Tax=Eumeta variegata TaxID=151549 RepID=A0A4C1UQA7_EUMVA|nr:hypothetical protein EVAR_85814_1 [Eumeta japonica]